MRIPEVQERLREKAEEHNDPELDFLASELSRRSPKARSQIKSQRMTPEIAEAIRAFHRASPDAAQTHIAAVFNVNPGRVSEALNGFRE